MISAAGPGTNAPPPTRAAALASYYDAEVDERAARALSKEREALRGLFVTTLASDGARSVLEIGCGPGIDGVALAGRGLDYTGIDLSVAAAVMCRGKSLRVCAASAVALPFAEAAFDAGWTMSTLMHLDGDEFAAATQEMLRVIRPGGLLAIGMWGDQVTGEDYLTDKVGGRPARYFRFRSDHDLRDAVGRIGQIEHWGTWADDPSPYHYQWALIRTSPGSPDVQLPLRGLVG